MKAVLSILVLVLAAMLAGCTTSSKVQEMIDASQRDYLSRAESLQVSVDVLKKSSIAGLEMGKKNTGTIKKLQAELQKSLQHMKVLQGYAEASKIMSAANTVKVAELEEAANRNQENVEQTTERLTEMDKLYEEVMVENFTAIAESANDAIEAIKAGGWSASTNTPVLLNEPIEIVAPDTSAVVTNSSESE